MQCAVQTNIFPTDLEILSTFSPSFYMYKSVVELDTIDLLLRGYLSLVVEGLCVYETKRDF